MAATFDPTLPTRRDHIRLAIGDKHDGAAAGNIENPLVQDEVIDAKLAIYSYAESLAQMCDALVSEFGQRPSQYSESGGVTVTWAERIEAWRELAKLARAGKIEDPLASKFRPRIAIDDLTRPELGNFRSD